MGTAEELALSSGTPSDVVEKCKGQEFLMKCLRKAKFSADLLQDTADACEINDLDALELGSGLMTVTQASEKLFLMVDEATTVVTVCRKECLRAGVNFGDGAQLTSEEMAEKDEDEPPPAPPAATRVPSQRMSPGKNAAALTKQLSQPSDAQTSSTTVPTPGPAPSSGLATVTAVSPAPVSTPAPTTASVAQSSFKVPAQQLAATPLSTNSSVDPTFLIKPPVQASTPASSSSVTPHNNRSHIPRPGSATPVTPAAPPSVPTPRDRPVPRPAARPPSVSTTPQASASGATPRDTQGRSLPTPAANGKHTPQPIYIGNSAAKPPRPSTAPLSARASTTGPMANRPISAAPTPSPNVRLPSYAKPTASHKARVLKEDGDVLSTSTSPAASLPVTFASTQKPLRRFLYMPPRNASTPEEKKEPKKPIFDNIRSSLLRPTAAFLAWSAGKSKASSKEPDLKTSQTLQVLPASSDASGPISKPPKPSSASKGVTRSEGGIAAMAAVRGEKSASLFEPFRLASAERHLKAQEELARKIEEKARLEAAVPKFKASPMPGSGSVVKTSPKRAANTQTDA